MIQQEVKKRDFLVIQSTPQQLEDRGIAGRARCLEVDVCASLQHEFEELKIRVGFRNGVVEGTSVAN